MKAIALKSYADFVSDIPVQFITTTGPDKSPRVAEFREAVGKEILRFKAKHMTTTGETSHLDTRWRYWFGEVSFDELTWKTKLEFIKDATISGLNGKQASIEYYTAIYYRFHAVLDDMSFADTIDRLVFTKPLREKGETVFRADIKPTAPFIHPPYVTEEYVKLRLENDPTDGIWLNPHNHHSIKLSGRSKEKAHLDAFMARKEPFLICPVVGPSGAGKTRLISEWMKPYVPSVSATDWDAGFVVSRDPKPWTKHEWTISRNTLIIIDYTFAYADVVKEIAQRARADVTGRKIRLIVIDHILPKDLFSDVFWQRLYVSRAIEHGEAYKSERCDALELRAEGGQSELLRDVVAAVASAGGEKLNSDHPRVREAVTALSRMGEASRNGNGDALRHPLFAALLGHAIRSGHNISHWNRRGLVEYYFSGETRLPWTNWAKFNNLELSGYAVGGLVSAATLRKGLPISQIKRKLPGNPKTILQYANRVVSSEKTEILKQFEPDILGEAFLLKYLAEIENREGDEGKQWAWETFVYMLEASDDEAEKLQIAQNIQETIQRLVRNLLNDKQIIESVTEGWQALDGLLRPDEFSKGSLLRQAISISCADALMQCRAKKSDRASQFAKSVNVDDIRAASSGQLWRQAATAFMHYFDWQSAQGNVSLDDDITLKEICSNFRQRSQKKWPMLMLAAHEGCLETAQAIRSKLIEMDIDEENSDGWTPLMVAAYQGQIDVVNWLIELGADLHRTCVDRHWTGLMAACHSGHTETGRLLLAKGALVNQGTTNNGWTPLMAACKGGHTETGRLLLAKGALVNQATTDNWWTPLTAACQGGHTETARLLLAKGALVNQGTRNNGWTPLMAACQGGHTETAALLLEKEADVKQATDDGWTTALIAACEGGHTETAALLLENGADVNQITKSRTALFAVCSGGHTETARLLLKYGAAVNQATVRGHTALITACRCGHTEIAALLLENYADVNQATVNGWTALIEACAYSQTETVRLLLDKGAAVNQATDDSWTALIMACARGDTKTARLLLDKAAAVNQATDRGQTALMTACKDGRTEITALLLENDADVNHATDRGWTALMVACEGGHTNIASLLLKNDVDVNRATDDGWTALMVACEGGHIETVRLLVDNGASVNQATDRGQTALMTACKGGHTEIAELLLNNDADVNRATDRSWTALMGACEGGHTEIATLLLNNDADVHQATDDGWTALTGARRGGHTETTRMLRRHLGKDAGWLAYLRGLHSKQ